MVMIGPNVSSTIRSKEVGLRSEEMEEALKDLSIVSDLIGGTRAMRTAGVKYLPKWESEDAKDYNVRLHQSFLFSGFKKIVRILAAKPFEKPCNWENFSPDFEDWFTDIDMVGTGMESFLQKCLWRIISDGITLILVDMQPTVDQEGRSYFSNLQEERKAGIRPYLNQIDIRNVLGYRIFRNGSREELEHIRIREVETVPTGPFTEQVVERVRVLYQGHYELWQKEEKTEYYILQEEGPLSVNRIPLIPITTDRLTRIKFSPPLMDVAWKNIECWQDSSNQNNSLAFARIPILYVTGMQTSEGPIRIAPNSKIELTDPQAKIGIVEHSGNAISSGVENGKRLKEEMEILGVQYISKTIKTATQRILDSQDEMSELKSWVLSLEEGFQEACRVMAEYANLPDTTVGTIDIFKDFEISILGVEDMRVLADMQKRHVIDKKTELGEAMRRRIVSDELDIDEVLAAANAEKEEEMNGTGSAVTFSPENQPDDTSDEEPKPNQLTSDVIE